MDNELECLKRLAREARKVLNDSCEDDAKINLFKLSECVVEYENTYKN